MVAPSTPPRSRFCLKFAARGVRVECDSRCAFKLCGRTIFGGDLLQTVVLCPGNANIRAQDSIFAVLEGGSDHMTGAGSLGMHGQVL